MATTNTAPRQEVATVQRTGTAVGHARNGDMLHRVGITMQMLVQQPELLQMLDKFANRLANAQGVTPPHLVGNLHACFAVVWNSINWNQNMFAVAQATFSASGKVGYEAKLVQSVLETSGQMEGNIEKEWRGDWSKVQGKHAIQDVKKEGKNGSYTKRERAPTWKLEDENGLSVWIRIKFRDRPEPDEFEFFLTDAQPRNSTLWATDPKTQLYYAAIRRFISINRPSILMGAAFGDDVFEAPAYGPDNAINVTPEAERPQAPTQPSTPPPLDMEDDEQDQPARQDATQPTAEDEKTAEPRDAGQGGEPEYDPDTGEVRDSGDPGYQGDEAAKGKAGNRKFDFV